MRLRPRRRNLVVWNQSVGPVGRCGAPRITRIARTRRVRRGIRTGALLTAIGLIRLARAVRMYWRPLLAGGVLTLGGFMQRSAAGNVVFLPGVLLFLLSVLLTPPSSGAPGPGAQSQSARWPDTPPWPSGARHQ
jgi:hypothetical protein